MDFERFFVAFMEKYDRNHSYWNNVENHCVKSMKNIFKTGVQTINYNEINGEYGKKNCQKCLLRIIDILKSIKYIDMNNKLPLITFDRANINKSEIIFPNQNDEIQTTFWQIESNKGYILDLFDSELPKNKLLTNMCGRLC